MNRKMLVIELNEAERHFLEKYVEKGLLPTFKKLLDKGEFIETRIDTWDSSRVNAWRDISPWIVWPSIYTGLTPKEHNIVGFGQDSKILLGNCIWDKLNERGVSTGVMSNLMSYPLRRNAYSLFYIPEALANTADCLPEELEPIQDFLIYTARNYSENFLSISLKATQKLMKSIAAGLPVSIALQLLAQIPLELIKGSHFQRNRALLQAKIQIALFMKLYNKYRPDFATLHMNHIAYMQHRYWRAAEPEKFKSELSHLDSYYFGTLPYRKKYEEKFKGAILDAFTLTDQFLSKLLLQLDSETAIVILSGLGQQKMDPCDEIHNPEIRISNLEKLLTSASVFNCEILTQMNPDLTLNFKTEKEAEKAAQHLKNILVLGKYPLFHIQKINHQLFLEGSLPPEVWTLGKKAWLNPNNPKKLPLFDFVRVSKTKDQSTAHHRDNGWMLIYGNGRQLGQNMGNSSIDITDISSKLIGYFD